jgi:hypothetical protein
LSHDVCLSGGARGADLAWGDAAMAHGHDVVHFGFAGHRSSAPHNTIQTLSEAELSVADQHLVKANKTMKRRWPISNQFVANLLRRNFYQIIETQAVYAISTFEKGMVAGGTSWAVQMYLDRFDHREELPCYVYDQVRKTWAQWDGGGFLEIDHPPIPSGVWTGIGTRELNKAGMEAIQKVW